MPEQKEQKVNFLRATVSLLLVFLGGVGVLYATTYLVNKTGVGEQSQVASQVATLILKRPTCDGTSAEFMQLKEQGNYVTLLQSSTNMYGTPMNDNFVNEKKVYINRSGSVSEVACGYLYVNAGVGNRPLQNYEDIYITAEGFGGHLLSSSAIINQIVNSSTEMIFSLDNIQYRSGGASSIANWAALLNVSNQISFQIALNTTAANGHINEVGIAYKCWNPQTGAVTTDCQLKVQQ